MSVCSPQALPSRKCAAQQCMLSLSMGPETLLWMRSAATLTGETGTYVYMAPEMIRHELYTTKADVYSWGVLLAECLAQRPPYEGLYLTPVQANILPGFTPPMDHIKPWTLSEVVKMSLCWSMGHLR